MRRGPGGGLFVSEPGVAATTEAVALHLHRLAITPAQLFEVRTAVELAVLERGVERLEDDDVAELERALEAEQAATTDELRDLPRGSLRARRHLRQPGARAAVAGAAAPHPDPPGAKAAPAAQAP